MVKGDKKLTFIEHLEEFRYRIIVCISAVILTTIFGYFFAESVITFLKQPVESAFIKPLPSENILRISVNDDKSLMLLGDFDKIKKDRSIFKAIEFVFSNGETIRFPQKEGRDLYAFKITDKFVLKLKAALILGIIFAVPIILWQGWLFITPGLTQKEKKAVIPMLITAFVLFPIGAFFSFFIMRYAISFLLNFAFQDITVLINVNDYIYFVLMMMLAFGAVFEMPVIVVILAKVGLISSNVMRKYRKYAIVVMMILAAVFTPPDVFSMIVLALPLLILYEVSIYLAKIFESKEVIDYE